MSNTKLLDSLNETVDSFSEFADSIGAGKSPASKKEGGVAGFALRVFKEDKGAIGVYLPERDGIQLRINPETGDRKEEGMTWYPEKGFIPVDADPAKFPNLTWADPVEGSAAVDGLAIREETGYVQVDTSWNTRYKIRRSPVSYKFGGGGGNGVQRGEPIHEVVYVEWTNPNTVGENPWKLQTFPLPSEGMMDMLSAKGVVIEEGDPLTFSVAKVPVGRPREMRVFFARRLSDVDIAVGNRELDLGESDAQLVVGRGGELVYAWNFTEEGENAAAFGARVARLMGGEMVGLQLLTRDMALVGARDFLERDVLERSQFRREIPDNMPMGKLPNRGDLVLIYEATQESSVEALRGLGFVDRGGDEVGTPENAQIVSPVEEGRGGVGSVMSAIRSQREEGNRGVITQSDGRRRTNFKDGRVKVEYPDGGRMLRKGGVFKYVFPNELGQIVGRIGDDGVATLIDSMEKIPDGVGAADVEGLKEGLVAFATGADGGDDVGEAAVVSGAATAVVVGGDEVVSHTMLTDGALYGGGKRGLTGGEGKVVVECVFEHNQFGKPNIQSEDLVLMATAKNQDVLGEEYVETQVVDEGTLVGAFKAGLEARVAGRRHRGGRYMGLSLFVIPDGAKTPLDFRGLREDEDMGAVVAGGIVRVVVSLEITGTIFAKNASLSVDMDADGNQFGDE